MVGLAEHQDRPAGQGEPVAGGDGGADGDVGVGGQHRLAVVDPLVARQRDLGYTLPPETYAQQQEKIDKLPQESRDNIRDQLVDIIVEDGDWEPSDALKDYPYEPTAAARADPELMQREQISLLEMNPLVIDRSGEIVALDGVGLRGDEGAADTCPVPLRDDSLLVSDDSREQWLPRSELAYQIVSDFLFD